MNRFTPRLSTIPWRKLFSVGISALLLAVGSLMAALSLPTTPASAASATCQPGSATLTPVVAINSGGPQVSIDGRTWLADQYVSGGHSWTNPSTVDIANTTADVLYRSERAGTAFSYSIPVPNGHYLVRLHFAEIYYGAPAGTPSGSRNQLVNLESGFAEVSNLNLTQAAGGVMRAFVQGVETTVRDGALSITAQANTAGASLAAVEVLRLQWCSPNTPAPPTPAPTPRTTPTPTASPTATAPQTSAAVRLFGTPRSGLPWHSGAWTGGRLDQAGIESFGTFRGRAMDFATIYSDKDSYQHMASNTWPMTTWGSFAGKLNYGLALLPSNGEGSLSSIANGQQDWVWRSIATNLKNAGHGDAMVRVGWEYNIPDWRWHATTSTVGTYKQAYRRVVQTMRSLAPGLTFEFGVNCGSGLPGSSDRLAALTQGYPGDDVVDLVGCDVYDWWTTKGFDDASWRNVMRAPYGPGVQDIADFARAHGKGASFGEWGLARQSNGNGGGDNPYFIEHMFGFFQANKDVVALECYFDEPDGYIANSLSTGQNPRAAQRYRDVW